MQRRSVNPLLLVAASTLGCTGAVPGHAEPVHVEPENTPSVSQPQARDGSTLTLPAVLVPPPVADARRLLAEEYSLSDSAMCGGGKLYSRGIFLPYGDPRAFSDADFFGRLGLVFGAPRDVGDARGYCLVHRATGLEVLAYSGASGPSYGGVSDAQEAIDARVEADPILRAGHPVDWALHEHDSEAEQHRLSVLMHAWNRRLSDAIATPAQREVITRLDHLLSSVDP